jgi:hypothetical protein
MINSYENLFFEKFNFLIAREWLKFDHIFISTYELQFLFVFLIFCLKKYVFENFRWGINFYRLCEFFFLGLPNLEKSSITLNTNFHIDLGSFVGD